MSRRRQRWFFALVASCLTYTVNNKILDFVLAAGDAQQKPAAPLKPAYTMNLNDVISEIIVGVLAVSLVVLGAWHSVEDLRRPDTKEKFNQQVLAVEETSGFQFVIFGSLMLTVLFFFMKYLIYILLLLFASGAVSTTSLLLEPVIAAWLPGLRTRQACKLPATIASWLGVEQEHSFADLIAEGVGAVLAVLFLIYRNNPTFGWVLQDLIAIMLLLTIQRTLRLPNLKVGTLLLVCTFFFDIFWVFLSPMIFKKSVMIEVATGGGTGQSVPMVRKIPALTGKGGQFKILGLGDIAIPGLLISMLLRHDLSKGYGRCRGYFTAGVIGYTVGLLATFVSLYLMKHGQPALLFLVPGTLVPTCIIALCKGELSFLWSASYGPEEPPEGSDEEKSA
jgi:signal peptide peptidase-like 2B